LKNILIRRRDFRLLRHSQSFSANGDTFSLKAENRFAISMTTSLASQKPFQKIRATTGPRSTPSRLINLTFVFSGRRGLGPHSGANEDPVLPVE